MSAPSIAPRSLEEAIRAVGARHYHAHHPFHRLLHGGELNQTQVQAWALNRFYYQAAIPRKDATLMARMHDPVLRSAWRQRLSDHDGEGGRGGGIDRWLTLAEGVGLDRDDVRAHRGVLPATRFAVEAYVRFVRERSLLEAIASSLTELFAPALIAERREGMRRHYDFLAPGAMRYFDVRLDQAPRDASLALDFVCSHARTADERDAVVEAVRFKCDVLWAQLDALYHAYVEPGHPPPGAFASDGEGAGGR
ncbi:MAG: pyrroloquinoline-quinone synthase PqqC [Myxococcota bacterium]